MTDILILDGEPDEGIVIPQGITTLEAFRQWTRADDFPDRGRIDWIAGVIEVDMSGENLFAHGTLKTAILRFLAEALEDTGQGVVFTDSTRICSVEADLSAEPDVVVLLKSSVDEGRVRLVPASRDEDGYVEIEGTVDLVVECVSRSSVSKDIHRLRRAYHAAGIPEYWIADARKDDATLRILRRGQHDYEEVDDLRSPLLGHRVELERVPLGDQLVRYRIVGRG